MTDNSVFQVALSRRAFLSRTVAAAAVIGGSVLVGDPLLARTPKAGAATPTANFVFGNFPVFDYSPWYAALEFGYWKDVGINFQTKVYPDETSGIEGIGSNAVQVELVSEITLAGVAPTFKDLRASFVGDIFEGFAPMIRPNSGMKTYQQMLAIYKSPAIALRKTCAQVKGKTWILLLGASYNPTFYRVLQLGGLTIKDVHVINVGVPEGATAFLHGEGDIYLGDIPHRLILQEDGDEALVTAAQLGPSTWTYPTLVSDASWVSQNEDTLLRAFGVWYRIVDVLAGKSGATKRKEALEAMASFVNKGSGSHFTEANAAEIETSIYPVRPTFENVVHTFFTPGISTNWEARLAWAVRTDVQEKVIKPGEVNPADLSVFKSLFTKLLAYKAQAEAGIAKGGSKASEAKQLYNQRDYVDAALLFS